MYINGNDMQIILGQTIKERRLELKISQTALSAGVCSQPMISSIENGEYIPNAILLSQLCNRLSLSMDSIMLKNYMTIQKFDDFNRNVKYFCEKHKYKELLQYLEESDVITEVDSNIDLQTYYYYYACAIFQTSFDLVLSSRYFQMALECTYNKLSKAKKLSSLEILIFSSLGVIQAKREKWYLASKNFETAIASINEMTVYDENVNSVFYQYAYSLMKNNMLKEAIAVIEKGIKYITTKNSHYMLGNLFFLLSECHIKLDPSQSSNEYVNSSNLFSALFDEKIYKQ